MAASEVLAIVELGPDDVEAGMALSTEAGWNQVPADWLHFITRGRTIGVRDDGGRLVASAAALPYDGPFGFIGMVLVTADWRRRGIATRLVDRCIGELRSAGRVPVLDATAAGAEVYRKQGFKAQFTFDRWEGGLPPASTQPPATLGAEEAVRLDALAFGAGRGALIQDFLARPGTMAATSPGKAGFAMIRDGRRARQAGPVVAASEEEAMALVSSLFEANGGPVFIDVQSRWRGIGEWLRARGFVIQRSFTRMALDRSQPFGDPLRLFAVAGPEFG